MNRSFALCVPLVTGVLLGSWVVRAAPQQPQPVRDPAAEALKAQPVPEERPEQKQTEHDRSGAFDWKNPAPVSTALKDQPNGGRISGFEFSRDPLGADKPFTTFVEVMKKESAARPKVADAQRKLLAARYDLTPKLDPHAKMARGKPV